MKCNAAHGAVTSPPRIRKPLLVTWTDAGGTYHRLDCPNIRHVFGLRQGTITQARPYRRPHHCLTREGRKLNTTATKQPAHNQRAPRPSFTWSRIRSVYHSSQSCPWARLIIKENRVTGSRRRAEADGRRECQRCSCGTAGANR